MQVLWIARSKTSWLPNQQKMTVPLDRCNITSLRPPWIALVMWRCIQCQSLRMTGTSCIKPGEWCNDKLWNSNINRFCNFDMFRNFVKNSNPMCHVALSMWLLFSLFPRNWQVLRQQRARTSKNTGAPPWQKPETARTSKTRLFLRC